MGMEIALNLPYRDYLVYGLSIETLKKHKEIQDISIEELYSITKSEDALLFAAHPFRGDGVMPSPKYLDGIEVFNGNPRNYSNNDKALKWAQKNNMIQISGSDFHEYEDISAGIYLPSCPDTIENLIKILRSGDYELTP